MQKIVKRKPWQFMKKLLIMLLCIGLMMPSDPGFAAENQQDIDSQILAAEAQLNEAKERQKAAEERVKQGSLGFIDWMLAKNDLTQLQKYDLEQARKIMIKACEENFSKWQGGDDTGLPAKRNNMVTCVWDENDAVSLKNTKRSFPILRSVNTIREEDQNYVGEMHRNPGRTNFYLMAITQTGADRAAGLKRHSLLQISCENLAFGSMSPANLWRSEIGVFNSLKESLGISVLSRESDVEAIENLADSQRKTVGHYTNLFWSVDQVMGIGYTDYGGTSCYSATKSSNLTERFAIYTIDEFEALFNEYYATVDLNALQALTDAAQKKLDQLREQQYQACTVHEYGQGERKEASCKESGGTVYTCTKCGYKKIENQIPALGHSFVDGVCTRCRITGVKEIDTVSWRVGNKVNTTYNQTYEAGQDVEISIRYRTASEYADRDQFVFDIKDPSVLSYEQKTNSSGIMHMVHTGKTTVTVYPADNPALSKTYTVSVTDVGGHDYLIRQAQPGAGRTTKTCSKCGYTEELTLPTAITKVTWWRNGSGTYEPVTYKIGDEVKIEVSCFSTQETIDNKEFAIEISDPSVAAVSYPKENRYAGTITIKGNGSADVKIYAKYDPSVKKEFTLRIGDGGGKTEPSKDGDNKTPGSGTEPSKDSGDKTPGSSGTESSDGSSHNVSEDNEINDETNGETNEGIKDSSSETEDDSEDSGIGIGETVFDGTYEYKTAGGKEVAITGCADSSTAYVKIPDTITIDGKRFKVTSIEKGAFQNADIKRVSIGKNVKTIGASAFGGCKNLTKVTMGRSVTKIGNKAFKGCKKLSVIKIQSVKLKTIGADVFKGISKNARMKVPAKKLSAYKKLFKNKGQGKNVKFIKQ